MNPQQNRKTLVTFLTNNLLIVSGLMMVFSGLIMQVGFHMGGHTENIQGATYAESRAIDPDRVVCGLTYNGWSHTHKGFIVIVTLLLLYHLYTHWNWYMGVFKKGLIRKNWLTLTLCLLFLIVAVTGVVPWIIDSFGGSTAVRTGFIEIHDKLTLLLILFLIIHVIKKIPWYRTAFRKLTNR